eukprot:6200211-Pleurochrysis_carterae.AAC.11
MMLTILFGFCIRGCVSRSRMHSAMGVHGICAREQGVPCRVARCVRSACGVAPLCDRRHGGRRVGVGVGVARAVAG